MTGQSSLRYYQRGTDGVAVYTAPDGTFIQAMQNAGVQSALGVNSTETTLSSGATFTGTAEQNNFPSVGVSCFSDIAGTLYFDFSFDGSTWRTFPSNGFAVAASTHEFHVAVKLPRYFRVRFVNGTGAQSTFQLYTYYGDFRPPNAPLNQTIGADSDAALVRVGSDPNIEYASSKISGYTVINKFGRNKAVGTTMAPISIGGIYPTPQVSGAQKLRVGAGNTNDRSDGTGARTITIQGIDDSGDLVSEDLTTNGTVGGTASTNDYLRLFRFYVSASGTYATQSAGSHAGTITIESAGGTITWGYIDAQNFPKGQSEVGVYTVPNGYNAYVRSLTFVVDGTKTATIVFFQRANILETAAPYTAMRAVAVWDGVIGEVTPQLKSPLGPFPAGTDIGFMGRVAATEAIVSVDFEILLIAT